MISVGHSDKVILYKGTRNLRYFCFLKQPLNLELLKEAVHVTLQSFSFFARKAVKKNGRFYYEDNNLEVPFFKLDDQQVYLGTKDTNDYLFCIKYSERCFVLSMFHSISDFYGAWQFFRTIIYHYAKLLGCDVPKFENTCENVEDFTALENADPYLKYADKDAEATYVYEDGSDIFFVPQDICDPTNIHRTDITVSTSKMVALKDEWKTSFAPAISYLLTESVEEAFDTEEKVIVSKFPLDMRKFVESNTPVNFSDMMILSLTAKDRTDPLVACKKIKTDILRQTTKTNCQRLMFAGIENAKIFEGSLKEKTLDLKLPRNSFTITYPGNLTLPDAYDGIIENIQLDSLSSSDSLRIVVYTFGDRMTFSILQNLIDDRYTRSLNKVLEKHGFKPETNYLGRICGDLYDDKRIEDVEGK